MASPDQITELLPDLDPSIAEMFINGVWEIPESLPVQAHYGLVVSDLTPRLTREEIDRRDEIIEDLAAANPDQGIKVIYAAGMTEYFGAGELHDHEEMSHIHVIYDGWMSLQDPLLLTHDRKLEDFNI